MTAISHEKLLELGFTFQQAKRSYKIEIDGAGFGVVQNGPRWLFSPLPMEHVSLVTVNSVEELEELVYTETGKRLITGQTA
ncbi:hypothetical protein [Chitinophaga flava]|uniref:Uncharacterized protein n=1 Tax=Chitinophaga flava TaxID=2259036 RepID=A0A365XUK1_9BACT|nr:hypothetical protein [Chitinophaga flava]RBL90013.1 hypothetical protein DF182_26430 [Chitinophaga flava]